MKNKPIQAGDLVMIVRGHKCCVQEWVGIPWVVRSIIQPTGGGWWCSHCNMLSAGENEPAATGATSGNHAAPLSWLIRIDPGLVKDEIPEREEINA